MTDLTHGSQGPVKTIPADRYGLSAEEIRVWGRGPTTIPSLRSASTECGSPQSEESLDLASFGVSD